MYRTQCVLALLVLNVGLVLSFSWDIVIGADDRLEFYNHNGTLMHTEVIPAVRGISSLVYDSLHNRMLISSLFGPSPINSFDIATKKIESLIWKNGTKFIDYSLAYDAVTETLFGIDILNKKLYSFSSKPGTNVAVDENILINLDEQPEDIAVDSCGGYIYWMTENKIERARFDGSERQAVIHKNKDIFNNSTSYGFSGSLVIDQQTQKMYWIEHWVNLDLEEYTKYLSSADLNGNNRQISKKAVEKLYRDNGWSELLTVSKDFIYWTTSHGSKKNFVWHLIPKNLPRDQDVEFIQKFITAGVNCLFCKVIAANYKIEDEIKGVQNCKALMRLLPTNSVPSNSDSLNDTTDASLLCVHGTNVSGESRCECTQGYIGERCEVPVCHNYCFQGVCSVSAEGRPKCRCKAGYSGERCEINACHEYCLNNGVCSLNKESEPFCKCTGDYKGDRCDVSVCHNYCFQGDCSASADGQIMCRCKAGYSGDRCEVNACHEYCSNNGVCSLNEESEPVCQCTGEYKGDRCDVPVSLVNLSPVSRVNIEVLLNTDVTPVTLGKGVKWTCAPTPV